MTTSRLFKAKALCRKSEPTEPDWSQMTEREQQIRLALEWGLAVRTPRGYVWARELRDSEWDTVDFSDEPLPAGETPAEERPAAPAPPAPEPAPLPPPEPLPAPQPPRQWYEEYPNVRWRERTTAEDFYFLYADDDDQDSGY